MAQSQAAIHVVYRDQTAVEITVPDGVVSALLGHYCQLVQRLPVDTFQGGNSVRANALMRLGVLLSQMQIVAIRKW